MEVKLNFLMSGLDGSSAVHKHTNNMSSALNDCALRETCTRPPFFLALPFICDTYTSRLTHCAHAYPSPIWGDPYPPTCLLVLVWLTKAAGTLAALFTDRENGSFITDRNQHGHHIKYFLGAHVPDRSLQAQRELPPGLGQFSGAEIGSFIAEQPAPAPHLARPEGCAALHIVIVTVPLVSRSCEHFPDGFNLHLLHAQIELRSGLEDLGGKSGLEELAGSLQLPDLSVLETLDDPVH